ncbi:unnamed protein product [Durusdinium trenchii]|uniref:Uncharacterized protein n=1 Tax=Durusdinium trenchii TaxID=1381693 RepID=A0ABP0PGX3_9DINO
MKTQNHLGVGHSWIGLPMTSSYCDRHWLTLVAGESWQYQADTGGWSMFQVMFPPKRSSFRNPNDASCALGLWILLVVAFIAFVAMTLRSFWEDVQRPTRESVSNERLQMPTVRLDVCELKVFQRSLNYSLLEHLLLERELEFLMPNGTEFWHRDVLDRHQVPQVEVGPMKCLRLFSMQEVPQESILPYHRWFLQLQGPIPKELQRLNYSYVNGLFIRPSLANASHPVSQRQESFLKIYVPFLAKNRTTIVRSLVALEKWSDSLGGRYGAPHEDTFYFDDSRIIPEALDANPMVVQQMPLLGHRLKVVLPVPTSMVRVHHHINDIMADIVTVLGRLASGIFIFSLLTVMFPAIREEKYHFFCHWPFLGLGNPSELDALLQPA